MFDFWPSVLLICVSALLDILHVFIKNRSFIDGKIYLDKQ